MKVLKKRTAFTLSALLLTVSLLSSCKNSSNDGVSTVNTSISTQSSTMLISSTVTDHETTSETITETSSLPSVTVKYTVTKPSTTAFVTTKPTTTVPRTTKLTTTKPTTTRLPSTALTTSATTTATPTTLSDFSTTAEITTVVNYPSSAKENAAFYSAEILQVANLVNDHRTANGIAPLELDSDLTLAACIRAREMAEVDNLSHTRPNGTSCFTVFVDAGINCSGANGENIACGQTSPQMVFDSWHNSPGHNKNMLNNKYYKIGIGVATSEGGNFYWVQLFAASVEPISEQ